jgi:hypothetical protein
MQSGLDVVSTTAAVVLGDRRVLDTDRPPVAAKSPELLDGIRDVLVVASSSRSGSSLFVQLLRHSSRFLHTNGEINPFLRLSGLTWPASGSDSDALSRAHTTHAARRALAEHLDDEIGEPSRTHLDDGSSEFVDRLHRRLTLQWPLEPITVDGVRRCQAAAAADLRAEPPSDDRHADVQRFHAFFLRHLHAEHPTINPYYYDLDRCLLRRVFPALPIPTGPPGAAAIEEPPFILVEPWRRPDDWQRRTLVIKTPSNCYRLGFLRALFPSARFRVLHLTRNPAAAINGLRDGWKHWGFHSHYIGPALRIRGYSDTGHPDSGWWKFDLAPGWRDHVGATLEEVCAFQWCAAHEHVLDFIETTGVEHRRVRFETLAAGPDGCTRVVEELCDWCGVTPDRALLAAAAGALPRTMAVQAPTPGRWRANADLLQPVLDRARVRRLVDRLEYGDTAEWT